MNLKRAAQSLGDLLIVVTARSLHSHVETTTFTTMTQEHDGVRFMARKPDGLGLDSSPSRA